MKSFSSEVRWPVLFVAAACLVACVPRTEHPRGEHDATVRHRFDDVERWTRVFDDPARDEWQKPEEVLRFLGVSGGHAVADLGAGTGYFTCRLAEAVGPAGRVFAVDVEPSLVEHIEKRCSEAGVGDRVEAVLADTDDPRLPDGAIDLILVVDTWHHIDRRLSYLDRLAAALRPGGRVAVVDFHEGELPVGPPPGHKLSREAVVDEFGKGGWNLVAESADLPYQYLLVFAPPGGGREP